MSHHTPYMQSVPAGSGYGGLVDYRPPDVYGVNRMGYYHKPLAVAMRNTAGAGLGLLVGTGNYMTRNYRQHPVVGLQTATHKKDPVKVLRGKVYNKIKAPPLVGASVSIPTVSNRRVKNKILVTTKAMPYKSVKQFPSYKKVMQKYYASKKKGTRRKTKIPLGIPQSKVVRFRLVHSLGGLGTGGGTLSQWVLKANSLNDPTQSLGAGLPLFVDQWAAMYSKYIVLGSKVIYKPQRISSTGSVVSGIHLADNTTSLADHDYYREAKLTKSVVLTDQRPNATIVMKYSGKKFWKLRNIKDDSEQEATFSTTPGDPTDIAYFHLYNQDLSKAEAITIEGTVIMEFIVLLTNPVIPTRSSL